MGILALVPVLVLLVVPVVDAALLLPVLLVGIEQVVEAMQVLERALLVPGVPIMRVNETKRSLSW